MKLLILTFLVVFLTMQAVGLATDFSINTTVDEKYFAGRTGLITLTITNPFLYADWFTVSALGVPQEWVAVENTTIKVFGDSSQNINIFVRPSKDATPFIYKYILRVSRVSISSAIEKELLIDVRQITSAIIRDFSTSCETCADQVTVSGTVQNVGTRLLNMTLDIKVAGQEQRIPIKEFSIQSQKPFEITFSLAGLSPNTYNAEVKLIDDTNNAVLYSDLKSFIVPVVKNIIYDKEVSSSPFGNFVTLIAINKGNALDEAELQGPVTQAFYSLFSGPQPDSIVSGNFLWKFPLDPNQSTRLSYSEIYWPTYAFIVLVLIIAVFVYWQFTALTIKKKVSSHVFSPTKETSITLHIKNRRNEMDKVIVRDIVPPHFSIMSKFVTIRPVLRKVAYGTELIWKVGKLRAHEERVLHYVVKPVREHAGKIKLPSAAIRAFYEGKQLIRRSNVVILHGFLPEMRSLPVEVQEIA